MNLVFTPVSFANNEVIDSQIDSTGVTAFLNESQKYTSNSALNFDINDLFENSVQGNLQLNGLLKTVVNLFGNELKTAISSMISILIIIIIHSILKSIIESLGNDSTSKIAYFVQYLIIVTILITAFTNMLEIVEDAISDIVSFMNLLVPLLITLMLTTGSIVSSSVVQPILLLAINLMGNLINNLIIPLIMISTTLSIVSNFSDKIHVDRLSKFIKSSVIWILGVMLTVFVCILSIEGTLSSSVDGFTSKTAKAAISTFIPVVGKIMGDSLETVIGCANVLKSAVGVIGTVIIFSIVILPIIKVTVSWALIKLISALCEIIADEKIVKLLDAVGDSYKTLFAILISVSIMFIVGITLVIKMTAL